MSYINIDGIYMTVEKKKIKNMYIRITPPKGEVNITAPFRTSDQAIYHFALSRIKWVKEKRRLYASRTPDHYANGETHYLWGVPYVLRIQQIPKSGAFRSAKVFLKKEDAEIVMAVPAGSDSKQRESILNEFYRRQLKAAIPEILEKSQRITGCRAQKWTVRNMSTRWGTCNIRTAVICFNLQLAKKSISCLEYIAIHELTHLLEKGHGERFKSYMDNFCPNWRILKKTLNEKVSVL